MYAENKQTCQKHICQVLLEKENKKKLINKFF